jgi:hypothetical protein|tara:strand:+ start:7794 stop:8168 length:375 start_codon:yes stop_codon:yes gene_type:complete
MKKNMILKTAIFALSTWFISSAVTAEEFDMKKYSYRGDKQSQNICKSVVKDDAAQLDKLLRKEKLRVLSLQSVDYQFTCNKMDLRTFAINVNANDSQEYLMDLDQKRGRYNPRTRVYIDKVAAR